MDREKEKRLEAFETMYRAVDTEYQNIVRKIEILKGDGRENSVSFKDAMRRKAMYYDMLELYKIYDL